MRARPGRVYWGHLVAPWGLSGSFVLIGSIMRRLCVRVDWGNLVAPWGSSVSFVLIGSILTPPWSRLFHSFSFGLYVRALSVVGFIQFRWVHSVAPCGSSCSFGSLGPFWRVLGVIGSIRVRSVHLGTALGSGSFAFVVFILARPSGRRVHSGSFGYSWAPWGSFGFILARTGGRQVHSGWLFSFGRALGVVWFIHVRWVHSCALCRLSGSFGLVGFTRAHPVCHWVHSGSLGPF